MPFDWRKKTVQAQSAPPARDAIARASIEQFARGDWIGGEFRVLDVFSGGMGAVYVVQHRSEPIPFVLKTIKKPYSERQRTQFLQEAEAWVALGRHRNIVHARFATAIDGEPYVAADFVPTTPDRPNSLVAYVGCPGIPAAVLIQWCAEFGYAMQHAKSRGMVAHRDIKPANLMLGPRGELLVTDFGIARMLPMPSSRGVSGPQEADIAGTLPYMAPEQFLAPESVDHRADIYAFGVTLYQIATGRLPFRALAEPELIREIVSVPPSPIDHPIWEICSICLAKRVGDRFQSYDEFMIAVRRLANGLRIPCPEQPRNQDDQAELLYAKGMTYAALGQTQLAMGIVQEFVRRFPNDDRGWTELGRILLMEGDANGAVEACRNSIRIAPFKSIARNNLGIALSRLGRNEEAIEQLNLAASHDPLNSGALLNQAGPLFDLGLYDRAIEVLRRATKIAPSKSAVWVNLGSAYLQIGALDDAESCLQRAMKLAPGSEHARSLMADLKHQRSRPREVDAAQRIEQLIRRGELDEAEHELAKQCQIRPDHANTWYNRGVVALGRNRPELALQYLETAVALSPQDAEARQRLVKLKVAAGRLDEALLDLRPLQADPKHKVKGECLAAQIKCALGRGEEARASLTELITKNAECDLAWFVLSEVLESIGNLEGALAAARGCVKALLRTGGLGDNIRMARARVDNLEKRLSRKQG